MIEWSESDELIRESVREFIAKEVEPHRDGLERGELSPYPVARKLFSEFGLDAVAAEAVKTMLDKERAKAEATAAGESESAKRSSGGMSDLGGQVSMAAVLVSRLPVSASVCSAPLGSASAWGRRPSRAAARSRRRNAGCRNW